MSESPPAKVARHLKDHSVQALISLLESSRPKVVSYPDTPLPLPDAILEMLETEVDPSTLCDLLIELKRSRSYLPWEELLTRADILLRALSVPAKSTEMHTLIQKAAFYSYGRGSNKGVSATTKSLEDKLKRSSFAEVVLIFPQIVTLSSILVDSAWPSFAEEILSGLLDRAVATDEVNISDLTEAKVLLLSSFTMQLKLAKAGELVKELGGLSLLNDETSVDAKVTRLRATFNLECCRFYLATSTFELAYSKAMAAVGCLREEHPVRLMIDIFRLASQASVMKRKFDVAKVFIREAVLLARTKFGKSGTCGEKHAAYIEAMTDLGFYWQNVDSDFRPTEIYEYISQRVPMSKRFLEVKIRELEAQMELDRDADAEDPVFEIMRCYQEEDASAGDAASTSKEKHPDKDEDDEGEETEEDEDDEGEETDDEHAESDDDDYDFEEYGDGEYNLMYHWDKLRYVLLDFLVKDDHPLAANIQRVDAILSLMRYYKKPLKRIWRRDGRLSAQTLQRLDNIKAKLLSSLDTAEKTFGGNSLQTACHLDSLGIFYWKTLQFSLAESTLTRAVAMKEAVLGFDDFEVALTLRQLARVYMIRKEYDRAVPLFVRCIEILRKMEPPHRLRNSDYEFLIMCYRKTGNAAAARMWEGRLREFKSLRFGHRYPEDPVKAARQVGADEPKSLSDVIEELTRMGAFA